MITRKKRNNRNLDSILSTHDCKMTIYRASCFVVHAVNLISGTETYKLALSQCPVWWSRECLNLELPFSRTVSTLEAVETNCSKQLPGNGGLTKPVLFSTFLTLLEVFDTSVDRSAWERRLLVPSLEISHSVSKEYLRTSHSQATY